MNGTIANQHVIFVFPRWLLRNGPISLNYLVFVNQNTHSASVVRLPTGVAIAPESAPVLEVIPGVHV